MKSFDFKIRRTFIAALAFACITLLFCCLATVAALEPTCAGQEWNSRPYDSFVLFLGAALCAGAIGRVALGSPVWRGSSFRINGISVRFEDLAYRGASGMLAVTVIIMAASIYHYWEISSGCSGG
jgi:hypothetical protein